MGKFREDLIGPKVKASKKCWGEFDMGNVSKGHKGKASKKC